MLKTTFGFPFGNRDFALARYNSNGTLDTTFGTGGKVTTDFSGNHDWANGLAIQSDGKILTAGVAYDATGNWDFALARYNSDGTLDATFGLDGKVTTELGGRFDEAYALALQPDGKIVAAGVARRDFAFARYNPDGTLDASFGIGGTVTIDFSGSSDVASAIAIQSDGRIVAAGTTNLDVGREIGDFALARYDSGMQLVSDIGFDPTSVRVGASLTATFSGTNLTDERYFDIRFRSPGSTRDEVVLNWQRGRSAGHTVASGTVTGTWTVTGVRAHQDINNHNGDFVSISAILTVIP